MYRNAHWFHQVAFLFQLSLILSHRSSQMAAGFPRRYPACHQSVMARIEVRGGDIWLHEQHEIGVGRYSDIVSHRMASMTDAVKALVHATGGPPIDGISVDWSR